MRLILVDDKSELVRCNFSLGDRKAGRVQVERLSKVAAHLVDEASAPENYELGSFVPYEDAGGFFVFLADQEDRHSSPTTLEDVMSSCNYVGYLRRH